MGIHSGVNKASEIAFNRASARWTYSGAPLLLAKAVGDAGHGGQVTLSEAAFQLLEPEWGRNPDTTPLVRGVR